jgi:MOSC domain-containing protein YiiM
MTTPHIVSVQVGLPRSLGTADAADPMDRPWTTGFFKEPVAGPVVVGPTGLNGDGQADLVNHGGPNKAVLAYAAAHYPGWREELGRDDLPYGGFGENLTLAGLDESAVCVGDVWAAGDVLFEVSQPRQPCWKLARRWRVKDLALCVQRNGRSGWYFRVLRPGELSANVPLVLRDRPAPEWTVARANRLMHHDKHDLAAAAALLAVPALSASWRAALSGRLAKAAPPDELRRLAGG